jgi:hypothetical protein
LRLKKIGGEKRQSRTLARVTTDRKLDDVESSIQKGFAGNGFGMLYLHDIQETLRNKGYAKLLYKVIVLWHAEFANRALTADTNVRPRDDTQYQCLCRWRGDCNQRVATNHAGSVLSQADLGTVLWEVGMVIDKLVEDAKYKSAQSTLEMNGPCSKSFGRNTVSKSWLRCTEY